MDCRSRRARSSHRGSGGGRALAVLALLGGLCSVGTAGLAPLTALAYGDLTGRAELGWQSDKGLLSSDSYFRQAYLLQWRRPFTETIVMHATLRYQDDRGTLDTGDAVYPLRARQLMPAVMLEYKLEEIYMLGAWNRTDNWIYDGGTDTYFDRSYQQLATFGWYRPQLGLELNWFLAGVANRSVSLATDETRAGLGFLYAAGGFRFETPNRLMTYRDDVAGLSRLTVEPRANLMYSLDGGKKYMLAAWYHLDYVWITQESTRSGSGSVPSDVLPVAGLFVVNPIPIDTTATPMQPEPRLIDGNVEVSAGISLGPDGASFQNIGLDMGRATSLDQLRLIVRGGAGQPVQFGGPVTWAAYWSQDGTRWIPIDGAAGRFDFGLSAYVVDFAPTPARYFKVVNFGVNTIETFVTELQPFVTGPVAAQVKRTSHTLRQTLGLQGNWRPWEKLQLAYNGLFDANRTTGFGPEPAWFSDLASQFVATLGPFADLTYGVSAAGNRLTQPGGYLQTSYFGATFLSYRPFDEMEARLEGRWNVDRVNSIQTNTPSVTLSAYANPWQSLRFSGSLALASQRIEGGGTTDFVSASALAWIDLVRNLELRLDLNLQRTVQSYGDVSVQDEIPLFRIINFQRLGNFVRWRPSNQLDLIAGVGYAVSAQGSGLTQSYILRWYPFPNGTVHLDMEYREELDPLSGRSYRQFIVVPRWNVNRWMLLQFSYNRIVGTGDVPISQQTLFAQLSLFL